MFKDFETTKNWIEKIQRFGSKLDLSRITAVMARLGNPEREYPTIHVAGTNGKGSTASYIKNILMEAGYKVGIYISPYIVKFNERIAINNDYISDEDVIRYTNDLLPIWNEFNERNDTITFFEVLTIMCFLYFRDQLVDYGVIEVGLGGRLDATNIITPEVSVITNISYDHMNVLGNTLESIALNKLGIVKPGVPLVTAVENPDLHPLFRQVCEEKSSELTIVDFTKVSDIQVEEMTSFTYEGQRYQVSLTGYHQVKNAVLAIEAVRCLAKRKHLAIDYETIKNGLLKTKWPGRFEIFNHNIVLDGAHNIGGIEALKATMTSVYKGKRTKALVSIMHDKEHQKIIDVLDSFCDELYFTQFEYARRADAEVLFGESHNAGKKLYLDYREIFNELKNLGPNEILLVTGSLYFISEIRKLLVK